MKKLFLLFAALPLILCAAVEMPEFKLKDFGDNGSFKLEAFDGKDVNGRFTLYNGKSKKFAIFKNAKVDGNKVELKHGKLTVTIDYTARNRMVLAEVSMKNDGSEDLWLEPGFRLTLPRTDDDWFFNGFDTIPVEDKALERLGDSVKSSMKK